MILITTYQRPKLLLRLLKELEGEDIVVFDDGSDFDHSEHSNYCDYFWLQHKGKKGFWRIWRQMFYVARNSDTDEFIFLQDDLYNIDLKGLRAVETPDKYVFNLMDVGPDRNWTPKNYCDCVFKTNRKTLEAINWRVPAVNPKRWERNPQLSSGVGQRLSMRFYRHGIPMILPEQNYASHGDCESKMHPNERKRNPLIATTGE